MLEKERDEALRELEEFQKTIDQLKSKTKSNTAALDKAKAQAARIAEQLRKLLGGSPKSDSS